MTLLTLPAILLLRAHPKQISSRSPYSLGAAHARKGWLFPQGFCSLFVLVAVTLSVKESQERQRLNLCLDMAIK
jgi:hypothetical protein